MTVDTLSDEKLAACPFCKSAPNPVPQNTSIPFKADWLVFIWCENCNAQGPRRETEAEAIAAWNTRTELQSSRRSERDEAMLRYRDWHCCECGCKSFARVDEVKEGGKWGPGPDVRCLNCKQVSYYPDLSALAPIPAEASLTTARADGIEVDRLREAAMNLMPYLVWQLSDESPGYHPTMRSAIGAFEEVFFPNGYKAARQERLRALSPPANEPAKDETEVTR